MSNWKNHVCVVCKRECDDKTVFWKRIVQRTSGAIEAWCTDCKKGNNASVPDVWYGYGSGMQTEENICSPETGQPIPFYDKTSKAAAMKQAGVKEAGDRHHGARTTFQGGKHN